MSLFKMLLVSFLFSFSSLLASAFLDESNVSTVNTFFNSNNLRTASSIPEGTKCFIRDGDGRGEGFGTYIYFDGRGGLSSTDSASGKKF